MSFEPLHIKDQARIAEVVERELEVKGIQRVTRWEIKESSDVLQIAAELKAWIERKDNLVEKATVLTVLVLDRDV